MSSTTRPVLETGWRPDTPADDTLHRRCVLALSASWAAAAEACGGRILDDDRFVAADHGRPTGVFNSAVLRRPLHGRHLAAALDDIEGFYDGQGTGSALLFSPWPTPDLRHRGWELEGHPPLLLRPPGSPADAAVPADHGTAPDELAIAEVTGRDGVEDWCRVAVEGYPFDELQPYRPGSLLDERILADDRFRLLVGYVAGRPVCIGAPFVEHGINLLFLAATRPEARGNGYYTAMTARRLAARPDLPAAALVSDMSRPLLVHRFDFLKITRFTLWARPRRQPATTTRRTTR